ncbi:MAG: methionyl-tRNA formyltransferase [bacterium]
MRIAWVGFHAEGLPALGRLLQNGVRPAAVITLPPKLAEKKSGAEDYSELCREFEVPIYFVRNINDNEAVQLLQRLSLDVLFVIGWTQILHAPALRTAALGVVGAHASLLPRHRGRAPINWALIKGETQTGNSLMWLAESVDAGALIDQTVIPITPYDTCATLYQRVAESNRDMIWDLLIRLQAGERPGTPQAHAHEPLLPGRKPEDGLINWRNDSAQIYDFIRALTRPYPGAFSWLENDRWRIWKAGLLPGAAYREARAGEIVGAMISPEEAACGLVAACSSGAIVLLELENESGKILSGRNLSARDWSGKTWGNTSFSR